MATTHVKLPRTLERPRGRPFPTGRGKTPGSGRKPGVQNLTSRNVREMIIAATEKIGGLRRLVDWIKEDPKHELLWWTQIWPRLLPLRIAGSGPGGEFEHNMKIDAAAGAMAGGAEVALRFDRARPEARPGTALLEMRPKSARVAGARRGRAAGGGEAAAAAACRPREGQRRDAGRGSDNLGRKIAARDIRQERMGAPEACALEPHLPKMSEIAIHEAGHAVVARALGLPSGRVTMFDHDGNARCYFRDDGSIGYVLAVLAGRAATEGILGYATAAGCSFDDGLAANRLMAAGRDLPAAKIAFHDCLGHAKCLIRCLHRPAVERVARALLERETLSGAEIDRLMEGLPGAAPLASGRRYSITSSTRSIIDGGTARPSAVAVLRFTTISNLVGNCTGRSPGFSPRRIRST
jgi:hypothetical protein